MAVQELKRNYLAADPDALAGAGGNTVNVSAAVALKIGDAVHVHTVAGQVTKTAVTANGAKFAGVVVGGGSTFGGGYALYGTTEVGLALVAAAQSVVLQVDGIANVVADGVIAAGDAVVLSATVAGRVITVGATPAGQLIGIALKAAAAAGDIIQILIARR